MARTMQPSRISRVSATERKLLAAKAARKAKYDRMVSRALQALAKGHKAPQENPRTRRRHHVLGFSRDDVLKYLADQYDLPANNSEHAHLVGRGLKRGMDNRNVMLVSGESMSGTYRLALTTSEKTTADAESAPMSIDAKNERPRQAAPLTIGYNPRKELTKKAMLEMDKTKKGGAYVQRAAKACGATAWKTSSKTVRLNEPRADDARSARVTKLEQQLKEQQQQQSQFNIAQHDKIIELHEQVKELWG